MSTLTVVVIAVLVGAAGFYLARYLFRVDERVEDRRRAAAKLAGVLSNYGLVKIPDCLIDYSVGDYSAMGTRMIDVVKLFLSGERAVLDEFEKVFANVLDAKLKTDEGRAYVEAKLREVTANQPVVT